MISALDIYFLLEELQILVGGKVDKVYHPSKKELILQFFVSNKGKQQLFVSSDSLFLSENKFPADQPDDFCLYLRKKLNNSRLRSINQLGFERIVSFEFETKEAKYSLVFELFSKGNILLLKDNVILAAVEYQKWASRIIKPKAQYIYPKREHNFLILTKDQLKQILTNSNKSSIVKSLATDLSLGGIYAEEACLLADIDKESNPKDVDVDKLFRALQTLKDSKLDPQLIYKDNQLFAVSPFRLQYFKDLINKPSPSFSSALDTVFSNQSEIQDSQNLQKQLDKINLIIEKQEQQIKDLEQQEKDAHKATELLYNNYQLVSDILKQIKDAQKTLSWKDIDAKLRGHKIIKQVNPRDKSIIIELEK